MKKRFVLAVFKANKRGSFTDGPHRAHGNFQARRGCEDYCFVINYGGGLYLELDVDEDLALHRKDATCVCTGVDPAIRFQFSTQQHFESFSETVKDVVELRRLSLLKARLATRLLTSRKPPALNKAAVLARVASASLPFFPHDLPCHSCKRTRHSLVSCAEDGRHAWCTNCLAEQFKTTVRALKAAPSWRCPVCEAECTCPACQKAQGVFPGLPLVCEHGANLDDPALAKFYASSYDDRANAATAKVRLKKRLTKCLVCQHSNINAPKSKRRTMYSHPYVPSDSSGRAVCICDACAMILVTRRQSAASTKELILVDGDGSEELCCGCGKGTSQHPTELVCCSAKRCPRSFCNACLPRLQPATVTSSMRDNDLWQCPPCTYAGKHYAKRRRAQLAKSTLGRAVAKRTVLGGDGGGGSGSGSGSGSAASGARGSGGGSGSGGDNYARFVARRRRNRRDMEAGGGTTTSSRRRQKSRRLQQSSDSDSDSGGGGGGGGEGDSDGDSAAGGGAQASGDAIDGDVPKFWADYAKHIDKLRRQASRSGSTHQHESEDVCFCCKDGGMVVSCDFNHGNCPKVYHQECLGFEVPEDSKRWVCPRHHCRDCLAWARHVCRYCPTSFCARHYRRQVDGGRVKQARAPRSQFLQPFMQEFVCDTCCGTRARAVSRRLLPRASLS